MFDPYKHHRRSIRLKGYDYSQPGTYFVTICTRKRMCLFGDISNGEMVLNPAGKMVEKWWLELENKFPTVKPDACITMPNHFHGIIVIVGADLRVCPNYSDVKTGAHTGAPLPKILQWFKTMTTNEYLHGVKHQDWLPFTGKLWQRDYYEHIVRNDRELHAIREYIQNNSKNWTSDPEYPKS